MRWFYLIHSDGSFAYIRMTATEAKQFSIAEGIELVREATPPSAEHRDFRTLMIPTKNFYNDFGLTAKED